MFKLPAHVRTTQDVAVRSSPDDDAHVLFTLPTGSEVTVQQVTVGFVGDDLERTAAWGVVGYIPLQDLQYDDYDVPLPSWRVLRDTAIYTAPTTTVPLSAVPLLREGTTFRGKVVDGTTWIWMENGWGFVSHYDLIRWDELPTTPHTYTADSSIFGAPPVTQENATQYILNRGTTYDEVAVTIIARYYWQVAGAVGVDPVLALAQCLHETDNLTSWWAQRPRRNPAGIGVTGETSVNAPPQKERYQWAYDDGAFLWRKGLSFTDWHGASRVHIGRLLAYALRDDQTNAAQQELINEALAQRPLPDTYRGVAPTLRGLNGRWAVPGNTYADLVAAWSNRITNGK